MRYSVQYGSGPALDIEANDPELAWDAYKVRTGLRRKPGDEPPKIIPVPEILTNGPADVEVDHGPDSGGNSQPDHGTK